MKTTLLVSSKSSEELTFSSSGSPTMEEVYSFSLEAGRVTGNYTVGSRSPGAQCDPCSQPGQDRAINPEHGCMLRCKCKGSSCQQDFPPQTTSDATAPIKLTNTEPCKWLLEVHSSSEGCVCRTCSQSIQRRTGAAVQLNLALLAPRARVASCLQEHRQRHEGQHSSALPSVP